MNDFKGRRKAPQYTRPLDLAEKASLFLTFFLLQYNTILTFD